MATALSSPHRWLARLSLLPVLLLASCATPDPKKTAITAPMDVAMDTAGLGMFYDGTAHIPRGFGSATSFETKFELKHWGGRPENGASAQAYSVLQERFNETGTYQPLQGGLGVISLIDGRLLLRGTVKDEGKELDGDWFFDGKRGGGFRIAPKGHIFP